MSSLGTTSTTPNNNEQSTNKREEMKRNLRSSNSNSNSNSNHSGDDPEAAGAWEEESPVDAAAFQAVREYVRACPHVSVEHPAVQAALKGLDQELVERRRDRRLQRAFGRSAGGGVGGRGERGGGGGEATRMDTASEDPDVVILLNDDDDDDDLLEEEDGTPNVIQRSAATTARDAADTSMEVEEPHNDDGDEDDWHHVPESSPHSTDGNVVLSSSSASTFSWTIGARLAKDVIAQIALFEIKVSTPLQAVAVALHAALRGPYLQFACTGTVEKVVPTTNGFAPPVRELPPTHFLPHDALRGGPGESIEWRYRQDSFGTLVLRVVPVEDASGGSSGSNAIGNGEGRIRVTVDVPPSAPLVVAATGDNNEQPQQQPPHLEFDTGTFVNLQSFARALQAAQAAVAQNRTDASYLSSSSSSSSTAAAAIPPALHYKSLPTLLAQFVRTFHLRVNHSGGSGGGDGALGSDGNKGDDVVETNNDARGATTAAAQPPPTHPYGFFVGGDNRNPYRAPLLTPPLVLPTTGIQPPLPDPPTLDSAFPMTMRPAHLPGDFDDDLNVLGGGYGATDHRWTMPSSSPFVGGNLMGPNHPAFAGVGGGMSGVGPNSGFGMQPRFDPYGPPGGPTDPSFPGPPNHLGGGPPGRGRGDPRRPGGPGDPNPDHLAPPNSFHSNNMFL